jgi:transposase
VQQKFLFKEQAMNYYFGIDNSSSTHMVSIIDENEKKIKNLVIENNFSGFSALKDILSNFPNHKVGFELSHGPIVDFLRANNESKMFSLNPLKIKRFKETNNVSGNKDDKIDSDAIALFIKRNESKVNPMIFNSKEIEKLKLYRISHDRLTKEHARFKNKLLFILNQYFPLYTYLFSDHGSKVMLELILAYPTWNKLRKSGENEIRDFLIKHKYRVKKNTERVMDKINNYKHLISEETEVCLSFEAGTLAKILLILKENLKEIENKMSEIMESHRLGKVFKSLPGSGEVLSAKLLSIFGDVKERFGNANSIQCLYGTAPKNYQSGNYHKVMMRKACNKKARAILYQFAFSSLRSSSWAREFYDVQRKKGKTNSVAIRSLSNKWVKIIFSMWKNETEYRKNSYPEKKYLNVA